MVRSLDCKFSLQYSCREARNCSKVQFEREPTSLAFVSTCAPGDTHMHTLILKLILKKEDLWRWFYSLYAG